MVGATGVEPTQLHLGSELANAYSGEPFLVPALIAADPVL